MEVDREGGLEGEVTNISDLLPATSEGRLEAEVNVLLRLESDDEGRDVDHLFPDSDVSLTDENTSVMDGLGQSQLEDLKPTKIVQFLHH